MDYLSGVSIEDQVQIFRVSQVWAPVRPYPDPYIPCRSYAQFLEIHFWIHNTIVKCQSKIQDVVLPPPSHPFTTVCRENATVGQGQVSKQNTSVCRRQLPSSVLLVAILDGTRHIYDFLRSRDHVLLFQKNVENPLQSFFKVWLQIADVAATWDRSFADFYRLSCYWKSASKRTSKVIHIININHHGGFSFSGRHRLGRTQGTFGSDLDSVGSVRYQVGYCIS